MCRKHGRYLAITGRSMRDNAKMARDLGYLDIPEDILIDITDIGNLPAHRIAIMATGSQGEPSAVLGRLARGRHNRLRIQEGDTVVFSAHSIPGNEELIYRTINNLFQRGANVLYDRVADVHVSGHASQEEMKLMINLVRPKYLIPVHGELRHLKQHAAMAQNMGFAADKIVVVENGTPLEVDEDGLRVLPRLAGGYVFVDGASVGEIGWREVNDREKLAQSGIFFAVVTTNGHGDVIGKPEIISRGFLAKAETERLLEGVQETIVRTVKSQGNGRQSMSDHLESALNRYLYAETGRRPLVHVVVKEMKLA
jgi:ribonuclease J